MSHSTTFRRYVLTSWTRTLLGSVRRAPGHSTVTGNDEALHRDYEMPACSIQTAGGTSNVGTSTTIATDAATEPSRPTASSPRPLVPITTRSGAESPT